MASGARRPIRGASAAAAAINMTIEPPIQIRSEEHTSELQSQSNLVCRLLLEKKKTRRTTVSYVLERILWVEFFRERSFFVVFIVGRWVLLSGDRDSTRVASVITLLPSRHDVH